MISHKKLNLGSGEDYKEGFINIDWQPLTHADIEHDLNVFPYPFEDNAFEYIEAFHILEHLDKPFDVMTELHRILAPEGVLLIKVPHFSRGFTHSEHAHGFDVTFPLYFDFTFTKSGYFGVDFKLQEMKLHWMAFFHLLPYMGYSKLVISILHVPNFLFTFLANLSPALCSRVWCFWVGGFEEIQYKFQCNKEIK